MTRTTVMSIRLIAGVAAALSLCPLTAHAQTARLTLQSEPGDFIGQGGSYDITYTPENSSFFSPQIRRSLPNGSPAELLFVLGTVTSGSDNTFALLFFGTDQLGIPIQPGFYPDAQRADFASPGHPGLDVSFQNRGCNTVAGEFTIDYVTFATTPSGLQIDTFGARFEQHCEGATPALFGTFTYSATTPSAVPEPGMCTLGLAGLLSLGGWIHRRRALSLVSR
jgi:hypothetical protein